MNDTSIIIEVAKLDGFEYSELHHTLSRLEDRGSQRRRVWYDIPNEHTLSQVSYLTSRDAIIPVIEKQSQVIQYRVNTELQDLDVELKFLATARQLSIALLKATNKWKD